MFYHARVAQLSFYSAEASVPAVADLAGLLCGPGRIASFAAAAARLTVAVEQGWRARVIAEECALRGVRAELLRDENGMPCMRTPFRKDLIRLAGAWSGPSGKRVPRSFRLDGAVLRLWLLAAGRWTERGYVVSLDPDAPATHEPLARAFTAQGLLGPSAAPAVSPSAEGAPVIRVTGRKRLQRLVELVGQAPSGAESEWPVSVRPVPAS